MNSFTLYVPTRIIKSAQLCIQKIIIIIIISVQLFFQWPNQNYDPKLLKIWDLSQTYSWNKVIRLLLLRASTSMDVNLSSILHKKSYFFYFTHLFLQNIHINSSIINVGTRAQICILGLGPYLMIWMRPRRSKWLKRFQNGGSRTKRVGEYCLRRLSFSDRVNINQASTWMTWVTFQECPTIRMNLRHVRRR